MRVLSATNLFLLPTMDVTTSKGETIRVIEKGRLTVLDDPEVGNLGARYGDSDELLMEEWIPKIPGLNAPGDYADYASNPAEWIYGGT